VADVMRELVFESPFLEDGLAQGIVNLSALARQLRPRVEAELVKEVSEGALVMALRRLTPEIRERAAPGHGLGSHIRDLTVRSNLSEITFVKSNTMPEKQRQLLLEAQQGAYEFVTFTRGTWEVTAIFDSALGPAVERIFAGETVISRLDGVSAVAIRLATDTVDTSGVYYEVLKQLAMRDINVIEVVSTYTEFTIILERDQVDRAFSILLEAASRRSAQ
jgi:hypothetical protein